MSVLNPEWLMLYAALIALQELGGVRARRTQIQIDIG